MDKIKKFDEFSKELGNNITEVVDYDFSEQDIMFEMANLLPKRTGLKYVIWYGPMIPKHKPRIKVMLGDDKEISIQIEDHEVIGDSNKISASDLNDIFKWIDMNKEILLKYWNEAHKGTIDNGDVIDNIKKL